MNGATVSLAELVSRGMTSIQQTTTAAPPPPPAMPVMAPRRAPAVNAEVEQLLRSTHGLVERLTRLPASASNDMPAMRRYILHSVEYFITELSAQR